MSETTVEPVEEAGEALGVAGEISDEPDDDEATEDELEPEDEPDEEAEILAAAVTEKEIEKRQKSLDRESERHEKRIREILGADADPLVKCEACPPAISGYHYPADDYEPGSPDRALYEMLAGGAGQIMRHPAYLVTCEECNGFGNVLTGSRTELTRMLLCPICKGSGYIDTRADAPVVAIVDANGNAAPVAPAVPAQVEPEKDMWGRPVGHVRFGKFPIYLTPEERELDLAEGFTID